MSASTTVNAPDGMAEEGGFLPWQVGVARRWLAPEARARMAHAWLIHGLAGIGKIGFARAAAASLLCERPVASLACGACPACTWFASGNHPDVRLIRPDAVALAEGQSTEDEGAEDAPKGAKQAPSREIRVDQIRAMEGWIGTGSHRGGLKVVVLYPAESLNVISANALLKVLEEPPPHTVFLLVGDAPDRLLPTLVSRCRRLPLAAPPHAESLAWLHGQGVDAPEARLAAAGGAPMRAWRAAQAGEALSQPWQETLVAALAAGTAPDLGALAETLDKSPAADWLDALQRLLFDIGLVQAGGRPRYLPGQAEAVAAIAATGGRTQVAEAARWLSQQRRIATHPLNAKLFAQDALMRVCTACLSARRRPR